MMGHREGGERPKPWCPDCGAALWEHVTRGTSGAYRIWSCSNAACGYIWRDAPKDEDGNETA